MEIEYFPLLYNVLMCQHGISLMESDGAEFWTMDLCTPLLPFPIRHYRNVRGLGKSMVVFRLFEKLRYSNERSTIF